MQDLIAHIEAHREAYLEELFRLCRQPSISAQGTGMAEAGALVRTMLEEAGAATQVVPTSGYPVIFGEIAGAGGRTLSYYNHYDVQPVDPVSLWETDPFAPTVREGRIFARGVADDKGHLVARLCAFQSWRAVRGALPFRATFMVEGEEEIGSPHLEEFVRARPDLLAADANVWEGSVKDGEGRTEVYLGCKGLAYIELVAHGANRDLHSSRAAIVPNPAWRLVHALGTLKDARDRILIPGFYDAVRPATAQELALVDRFPMDEERDRALIGIPAYVNGLSGPALRRKLFLEPTCNICGIVSGYTGPGSKTVLPDSARVKLDFRLVPEMDPATVAAQLRAHLDAQGFGDIEVVPDHGCRAARTDLDSPIVQAFLRALGRVSDKEPSITPLMAATGPMYLLCQQQGIPTVSGEAVDNADSRVHAPNENIFVEDFIEAIKLNAALIEEYGRA